MLKSRKILLSHTALVSALTSLPVLFLTTMTTATLTSSSAFADATCGTYTNDVINSAYNCVPITVTEANFSPNGFLIGQGTGGNGTTKKNMYSTTPSITVGSTSARKGYVNAGVAISTGGWDSASLTTNNTLSLGDVSLYLDGSSAGGNGYGGISAAFGGKVWINNFTLDMANVNNGDINGIGAGQAYNTGAPNGGSLENYIHVTGDYTFKAVKTSPSNNNPVTGIRAIQNNDGKGVRTGISPKATIIVDGDYKAEITANYGAGVYVSGQRDTDKPMPEVTLNNTHIILHGRGNALKVGKANRNTGAFGGIFDPGNDGWGAGQLNFKDGANVEIDMTDATGEAIAVVYGGSIFDASQANSFIVNAKGNALRIGNDILTNSVQSSTDLIDVQINNANFRTTTAAENLIRVDQQQKNVSLKFTGTNTDLKAADEGWLINVEGTGNNASIVNMAVDGLGAQIAGLTNKTTAATLNLDLDNSTVWSLQKKAGSSSSNTATFTQLNLMNGSRINAFDDFVLAGNIQNTAGVLNLSNGIAGNTLTMQGDYIGSNNATLQLDSFLGGSGSISDRLINDGGTISGLTLIRINNTDASDAGAATDPGHGIKLVRSINGGTTTDDAFALDTGASNTYQFNGKTVVGAGAYAYGLYKGSNPTNTSATDEYGEDNLQNDWYLRSQLNKTDPIDPVDPEPQFTQGVPVYEAYPQVLLALNSLPTLQQRVGNRYWSNAGNIMIEQGADVIGTPAVPAAETGSFTERNGIWGRIEGQHLKSKPAVTTSGTQYDVDIFKMQAGLDGVLTETDNGLLIGGITVHYGHASADTRSEHGLGKISTDGYGFGGTLTWYGSNGFYVDTQAQATWYDSDLSTRGGSAVSLVDGNNGFGYALSAETGKRITLNDRWSVTPQAQLVYSNVDFDNFTDQYNGAVSLHKGDSLQGRIGISADYQNSWYNDKGMINRSYVYGIANLYYEFLDGSAVDVSSVRFASRNDRFWGGIGLGGSYNWDNDKYSIYGEGSVNTSLNNFGDSYAYKGTIGLRVKW